MASRGPPSLSTRTAWSATDHARPTPVQPRPCCRYRGRLSGAGCSGEHSLPAGIGRSRLRPGTGPAPGFVTGPSCGARRTPTPSGGRSAAAGQGLPLLARPAGSPLLTGAGLSTDSGIPDYRGPDAPPAQSHDLPGIRAAIRSCASATGRETMWAGTTCAMQSQRRATRCRRSWSERGLLTGLITQNVDRLHEDAGSINVVDLHGRFDRCCAWTAARATRADHLARLRKLNPGFLERTRLGTAISPPTPMRTSSATPIALHRGRLPRLRRNAQAGLCLLRRKRAPGPGGGCLSPWSTPPLPCWWPAPR